MGVIRARGKRLLVIAWTLVIGVIAQFIPVEQADISNNIVRAEVVNLDPTAPLPVGWTFMVPQFSASPTS